MRTHVNVTGQKRYTDDDDNPIELTGAELEIAESANAGGEVNVREVIEILKKYRK